MKNLIFSIFCALIGLQVTIAQVPNLMSYQAVIWDGNGNLVSEKMVNIKLSILQGSVIGTSVYSETHRVQTNVNGLVSLMIGGGFNLLGKISDINWGGGSYFLKTETDPTGGGNFTITGTTQLVSVPYALIAGNIQTPNTGLPGQVLKLDELGKPYWAGESFPTVNTISVNSISTTTAISGGNVSSDGGAAITTRGVVWSTNTNPIISLTTKTSNGTGTGTFSSSLTGLSPNIVYYIRAYATNSVGTGYGNELSFKSTASSTSDCTVNGANGEILTFSCYNLGAVATSDPYTPRWELNGDYWQWGRKEKAANGPSNGTVGGGNHEVVTVWNRVGAPMGAWSDANKTANDPCPSGFRLPTAEQWESIASTNIKELYFTFSLSYTHYDNGWRIKKSFDDTGGIYLPNAGERNYYDGSLNLCRSCDGYYWSSSYDSVINHGIGFSNFSVGPQISTTGRSIRCIVE